MAVYRCWRPDLGQGKEADASPVEATTAASAAESFAARWCQRQAEYPPSQTVLVRAPDDAFWAFDVTLRPEPVFEASHIHWPPAPTGLGP